MMKSNRTCGFGVIVLAAGTGLPWSGMVAAADPVVTCQVAKVRAAGQRANCLVRQQSNALRGRPADSARCETAFDAAIDRADNRGARRGVACRYLDNGNGTISDLNELNMWEIKTDDGSIHDVDNRYTWTAASGSMEPTGTVFTEFLTELNNCVSNDGITVSGGFAGYCDWVLPDIARLRTIQLGNPCTAPCVDPVFNNGVDSFTAAQSYWSSTPDASNPNNAWDVNFTSGNAGFGVNQALAILVRAVRGGR